MLMQTALARTRSVRVVYVHALGMCGQATYTGHAWMRLAMDIGSACAEIAQMACPHRLKLDEIESGCTL
jgi:hypothetical protein